MDGDLEVRSLTEDAFFLGDILIEPGLQRVTAGDGRTTELSRRQVSAIIELAQHAGRVVPRARMHEILCLTREGLRDKGALSHHIGIIRRAFADSAHEPRHLKTVRGQGYCLLQAPVFADERAASAQVSEESSGGQREPRASSQVVLPRVTAPVPWGLSRVSPLVGAVLIAALGLLTLGPSHEPAGVGSGSATADGLGRVAVASKAAWLESLHEAAAAGANASSQAAVHHLALRLDEALAEPALASPGDRSVELLAIGEGLMCLQAWERAGQAFEEALAAQRAQTAGPDGLVMAKALISLARVRAREAQAIDPARKLLVEAVHWLRSDEVPALERAHLWAAHAGLMEFANDPARADASLKAALSLLEVAGGDDLPLRLQLQTGRVRVLASQSDYVQAEALLSQLLSEAGARYGKGDRRLTPVLAEQGRLLAQQGQYESAVAIYADVVATLQQQYPDTHSRLIHARLGLAEARLQAGDAQGAVELYSRVIDHVRQKRRGDAVGLGGLKVDLSEALLYASEPEQAYAQVRQALALLDGQAEVPEWLRHSANSVYGAVLIELGRCSEGMRRIDEAIDQMFLQGLSDPRVTARIHARRARYEDFPCVQAHGAA